MIPSLHRHTTVTPPSPHRHPTVTPALGKKKNEKVDPTSLSVYLLDKLSKGGSLFNLSEVARIHGPVRYLIPI